MNCDYVVVATDGGGKRRAWWPWRRRRPGQAPVGWSVALVGTSGAFHGSTVISVLGQAGGSAGKAPDGTAQVNVTLAGP